MILIIGAGLTGLALSRRLGNTEHILLEKEAEPGGLCRSHRLKGFTFDYSGHFLHMQNRNKALKLKAKLGLSDLSEFTRKAAIHMEGRLINYPFQANLNGLEYKTIHECLTGFEETISGKDPAKAENYHEWLIRTFGPGMTKHFFFPYNRKFWRTDLKNIVPEFATWSIPRPSRLEVVHGAEGLSNKPLGYNHEFFYPSGNTASTKGIGTLPNALAKGNKRLKKNSAAVSIDAGKKKLTTSDGKLISYDVLTSTIPLRSLVNMIEDAPTPVKTAAGRLKYISVDCVNIGFKHKDMFPGNWIYFPERAYSFFRVGSYSSVMTEPGTGLYVEFSRGMKDVRRSDDELLKLTLKGLIKAGIIEKSEVPVVYEVLPMEPAYVIHDKAREKSLKTINEWLNSRNIYSIGRYGAWKYSTMEQALDEGSQWASKLKKQ